MLIAPPPEQASPSRKMTMRNSLRHTVLLSAFLVAVGFSIFFHKVIDLDYPLMPDSRASTYDVEIYIEFEGRNEPARLNVFIPTGKAVRDLRGEEFYNGSFGLTLLNDQETENRRAVWTYRYPADRKVLRYVVQTTGESQETPFSERFRSRKPDAIPFESDTVKRQAFIVWVGDIRRRSADDNSFAEFALKEIFQSRSNVEENADEFEALLDGTDLRARLDLAKKTLESQGLPARVAHGLFLTGERRRAEIEHWLEYRVGGVDQRFFPQSTPSRFLTIWYDDGRLIDTTGVSEVDTQISVRKESGSAEALARLNALDRSPIARWVSFGELSLTTQLVYQIMVTIPVGITLLVFLRQFIGIKTLGTFMPVLIGLAFNETALINGIILFTFLICLGLAARFYLERLQLLLVPRLAVVLIFIVIMMAAITVFLADRNQSVGLSISLFPMVIITMTIERMSIIWEESSPGEAIKHGIGSLIVASLTYLLMSHDQIAYLMFNFPELLLVLMAACLIMGRYTGLRLSEVWRFREIARSNA